MTKTEAAEILARYTRVQARKFGRSMIDRHFIEDMRAQALSESGLIRQAAEVCPHVTTIRAAGRRQSR